uniref:Gamma tubulin complex component protein N-terminal domain-containing protein n=1 Tax=Aegilops tauschii subsp. strangulata TaxID=200361 RepID=A0A453KXP7_AEGTS
KYKTNHPLRKIPKPPSNSAARLEPQHPRWTTTRPRISSRSSSSASPPPNPAAGAATRAARCGSRTGCSPAASPPPSSPTSTRSRRPSSAASPPPAAPTTPSPSPTSTPSSPPDPAPPRSGPSSTCSTRSPPTAALVRDVLYACQGIDGRYVRYDKASDTYDLPEGVRVPRSTRTLVRKLCEVGWLFRKVRGFISDNVSRLPSHAATEVGTVAQAFCSALQEELSDYYKLLAVLESYSLNPIPTPGSDSGVSGNYLSLRRLVVWLAEPTVRMRLMAVLVDGCRGLRGGGMAGAIHGHAQHGDPMVQDFMGRLLRRVCSPLFEMVRSWVLEGELEDVFGEFFIVGQPVKAESLWREGYLIQSDMLPSFISPVLAQRILRTGKSINFLRACCDDNGWAEAATEAAAYVGTTT